MDKFLEALGENISTIIGVLGTLLGTILGWILNNISKSGELKFHLLEWQDDFRCKANIFIRESKSKEQTEFYDYKVSLDIYNSSGETKILRDCEILFAKGKKVLFANTPKDDALDCCLEENSRKEEIKAININPKTVMTFNWQNRFNLKKLPSAFIWETDTVYLRYRDEKNKVKQIKLFTKDYSKHFSNSEENNNG